MTEDSKPLRETRAAHFRNRSAKQNWQEEGLRLQEAIITHEWFLDPRFSLAQLSERVGLNINYASHALNFGLGKPFKTILNELRVRCAKEMISQDQEGLLTIALNSGFGSKASFNRVFLKQTGKTPSEYRHDARLVNDAEVTRQTGKRGADYVK